jgi:glycerol uptake facilitator protein
MNIWIGEIIGTMILILLGDGVVANVVLSKNKGEGGGGGGAWIVITAGWGFAVAMAVYVTGWIAGAHINPAVTFGLLVIGALPGGVGAFIQYVIAQMIGAFIGAVLVWLAYYEHFKATENKDLKLAVFCTAPAIRNYGWNLVTEIIGTFMLLLGVLGITAALNQPVNSVTPYMIGILVFSIGLSLGGPTGYAINPARDLGPRIAHFILPIPDKRDSDWGYSWVPVVGPLIGGALGAWVYQLFVTSMLASYIQSLGG